VVARKQHMPLPVTYRNNFGTPFEFFAVKPEKVFEEIGNRPPLLVTDDAHKFGMRS
jgi:hypothetical protein